MIKLPLLIEPNELEQHLENPNVIIADLCKPKQFAQAHIPGAQYVNYSDIVRANKPIAGLLPEADAFSKIISKMGINEESCVVAYDDEGGGAASRFLWTLKEFGHNNISLLNGGLYSWANDGHPLTQDITTKLASNYKLQMTGKHSVDSTYIMNNLNNKQTALLDARSNAEYTGAKKFAEKGGHIPGAKHYEWTSAMDTSRNIRLLPIDQIQEKLNSLGLTKDKEIITYCQAHHRAAFSWMMLTIMGYENVKGYAASWSEWGNSGLPVE